MNVTTIREVIHRCFAAAENLAIPVTLNEVTETDYVPGFAPSQSATSWPAKMIYGKSAGGISRLEQGPVLNEQSVDIGWLYSPDAAAEVGDEIHNGDQIVTITKVAPLDQGAGVLFEVWYQ